MKKQLFFILFLSIALAPHVLAMQEDRQALLGKVLIEYCAIPGEDAFAEVKDLLRAGANVNAENPDGTTPLMHAALQKKVKICKLLLEYGADVEAQDNAGATAFTHAANTDLPYLYKTFATRYDDAAAITNLLRTHQNKINAIKNSAMLNSDPIDEEPETDKSSKCSIQ